jgi:hypothetical protein
MAGDAAPGMVVRRWLLLASLLLSPLARAGAPEFSYMTLNGITHVACVLVGISPELTAFGVRGEELESLLKARLASARISVISPAQAVTEPRAALLEARLVANKDPHGFYHYGITLNLRQKIPLGSPAGGYVSQVVWSDGESGLMQFNEHFRVHDALSSVLDKFIRDFTAQNSASPQ